jgi:tight adherence protein B
MAGGEWKSIGLRIAASQQRGAGGFSEAGEVMFLVYVIVGALVSLAVGFALFSLQRATEPRGELDRRIEAWVQSEGGATASSKAGKRKRLVGTVDEQIARRDFARQIATDLARADLAITVGEYVLMRGVLVAAGLALGTLIYHDLFISVMLGVLCYFLPLVYVRQRQTRRVRAFDAQLPDVLDHLVGSLRAGYGLLQAVEWVGKRLPNPAGVEFDRVVREVQLGRTLPEALDSMVRRINSDDLALIVTAIKIQYEAGGSLADILETTAHTIRERVRIQREIRVLTAQQQYSAYVLIAMPIGLAIFLFLINPEYESQLFAPGLTLCIPIGAVVMMITGFFVMRRIVDIKV